MSTLAALTCMLAAGTVGTAQAQAVDTYAGCGVLTESDSTGECVRRLQQDLNADGAYALPETGNFGQLTRQAVLDFQARHGLPAVGRAGPLTQQALRASSASPSDSEDKPTSPAPEDEPTGPSGTDTHYRGTGGGTAECTVPGDLSTIDCSIRDESPDSHAVYVQWEQGETERRVDNTFGSGTSIQHFERTEEGDRDEPLQWRFCTDIQRGPDDCSDWLERTRSSGAGSIVPAERCGPEQFADMSSYLTGKVRPPRCFPYQPEIVETAAGTRAVDPFGDGCSGPTLDDAGRYWDRRDACGMHDYGYDLLRYGVDTFREPTVDGFFLKDMLADCLGRGTAEIDCRTNAYGWRTFVRFGDVEPGDRIAHW